jgi:ribose transport system substrate-binding protein
MRRPRFIGAVASAAVIALLATACGSSGSSNTAPQKSAATASLRFDYANLTESSGLFSAFQAAFVAAARTAGVQLTTYNNNESGTTALTNAHLMVADHPDVIFEYNVVAGLGRSLGAIFTRAHIPCVAVNIAAPPCPLENLNNPQMGASAAQVVVPYMKRNGWTGANTTVLILQNATAGTSVNIAVRDFYSEVADQVPGMTKTAGSAISATTTTIGSTGYQVNAGSGIDTAYTAVQQVLQGIPRARHLVLFAINDDLALGGWRALVGAGRADNSVAVGLGGSVPAMEQLRTNPHWIGEDMPFLQGWSEIGIAMGVAIARGAKPPAVTYIPQTILTKSNVAKYFGSSNTTPRLLSPLPATDDYLVKYGVLQKFHNIEGLN